MKKLNSILLFGLVAAFWSCQEENLEASKSHDIIEKANVVHSSLESSANKSGGRIVGSYVNGVMGFDSQSIPTLYPYISNGFHEPWVVGAAISSQDYFPADWSGDGLTDLIVRNSSGSLYYYQLTIGPYDRPEYLSSYNVGNGFQFANYFIGDFTGDGKPDMIGRTSTGTLQFYPFNTTFIGQGGGQVIGTNFNYTDFFVADWSGDGITDLIVRDSAGSLFYFIFNKDTRTFTGGYNVGNKFNFVNYFIGDFNGDNIPDLIGRNNAGDLFLYPFNTTFIGQGGGTRVGIGFNFTDYFLGDWYDNGAGVTDLMVRNSAGDLILYPFFNNTFNPGSIRTSHITFGSGYLNNYTNYFTGKFGYWSPYSF